MSSQDNQHQFVKALAQVKYSKAEPPLEAIMECMLKVEDYGKGIQRKIDSLANLQVLLACLHVFLFFFF